MTTPISTASPPGQPAVLNTAAAASMVTPIWPARVSMQHPDAALAFSQSDGLNRCSTVLAPVSAHDSQRRLHRHRPDLANHPMQSGVSRQHEPESRRVIKPRRVMTGRTSHGR